MIDIVIDIPIDDITQVLFPPGADLDIWKISISKSCYSPEGLKAACMADTT